MQQNSTTSAGLPSGYSLTPRASPDAPPVNLESAEFEVQSAAHDVDIRGRRTLRYGAVSESCEIVAVAGAFQSGDEIFDASGDHVAEGVFDAGAGCPAYTEIAHGLRISRGCKASPVLHALDLIVRHRQAAGAVDQCAVPGEAEAAADCRQKVQRVGVCVGGGCETTEVFRNGDACLVG